MNKLILVGNGFDLAHGLPTSYKDFLNDFWKDFHLKFNTKESKELFEIDSRYLKTFDNPINSFNELLLKLEFISEAEYYFFDIIQTQIITISFLF
jgi:hypothetical protein